MQIVLHSVNRSIDTFLDFIARQFYRHVAMGPIFGALWVHA